MIADGVQVNSRNGYLGYRVNSNGTATVTGANTKWHLSGDLHVNYVDNTNGQGHLTIADGAVVEVAQTTFVQAGSPKIEFNNGTLSTHELRAYASRIQGNGVINTNGLVSDIPISFDQSHGLQQPIVLNSQSGQNVLINLSIDGSASLGTYSSLVIADGMVVPSTAGYLGRGALKGTATVLGAGSTWSISGPLELGVSDGNINSGELLRTPD